MLSSFGHNVYAADIADLSSKEHRFDFGTIKTKRFDQVKRAHHAMSVTLIRPGSIKIPLLHRVSAFLTHYLSIDKIIRERGIDVIVLYSVPTNGLQTVKLSRLYKIPILFRSIDVLHNLVPNRILRPATQYLEGWVYRNVDRILTLSPTMSEYVIGMGADRSRVDVLPLGVDTNMFHPNLDSLDLKDQLGLDYEDKVILFMGTLFEFSGVDSYLKQFQSVVTEFPTAKLLIVGGGPLLPNLRKLVTDLGLSRSVLLTGFQPFQMMPLYINLADICINPFVINETTRDIMPSKIIQYLACGKPVILTPLPGTVCILPGLGQGVVYSEIDDLARTTIEMLGDIERTRVIGRNGSQFIKQNHDEQVIARKLDIILNQIVVG